MVKASPLADPASPFGYVEVDQYTLRHKRHGNVFALGDVANLPTSKTGAAIREQAPVVTANLTGGERHYYDGYASCPLVTARHTMLLAEFDYDLKPTPTIPSSTPPKNATTWLPEPDLHTICTRHHIAAVHPDSIIWISPPTCPCARRKRFTMSDRTS